MPAATEATPPAATGARIGPCLHKRANHQHGDYARYRLDGCRCYACAATRSAYDERRAKALTAGTWQPFVAVEPVRAHVLAIKSLGFGDRSIAALAGVDRKMIRDLSAGFRHDPGRGNPPLAQVRVETARRILSLAVTDEMLPGATIIDATRTWQQIADLMEAGWTKSRIATEILGCQRPALQLAVDRVTVRNARAIAAEHQFVIGDEPAEADEISAVDWVLVERVAAGQRITGLPRGERNALLLALVDRGIGPTAIGERLGMSRASVHDVLAQREAGAA